MKKLKTYFTHCPMSWRRVLLMAVVIGVAVGILAQIDALNDTSLEDPAVLFDVWFLFAVFIVVNCRTWWDASLKCFVFFLISQPVIYLVQVPFFERGWEIFQYYPYWFKLTLLTLPGAAVAFLIKKKSWLSVAILSVANGYLAYACIYYLRIVQARFPRHLLSCCFCLALALFFVFALLEKKNHRALALALIAAVLAASLLMTAPKLGGQTQLVLEEGSWACTVQDESVVRVAITEGNIAQLTGLKQGDTLLTFENGDGVRQTYCVVINGADIQIGAVD